MSGSAGALSGEIGRAAAFEERRDGAFDGGDGGRLTGEFGGRFTDDGATCVGICCRGTFAVRTVVATATG